MKHSPVDILRNEHLLLRQVIEVTKKLQEIKDAEMYIKKIYPIIRFFTNFTVLYHHPKEGVILFPILNSKHSMIPTSLLAELCEEKLNLEQLIATIETAFWQQEIILLRKSMHQYVEELGTQMEKEEEMLFGSVGSVLTEDEAEMIYNEYMHHDEEDRFLGILKYNYSNFSNGLV